MSGDKRSYALKVSDHFFRLTTECLRMHSNDTMRYESLSSLVDSVASADRIAAFPKIETVRKHLAIIPTEGMVKIHLSVTLKSAHNISEVRHYIERDVGIAASIGDAISVLLFNYFADRKISALMDQSGLAESDGNGLFSACL